MHMEQIGSGDRATGLIAQGAATPGTASAPVGPAPASVESTALLAGSRWTSGGNSTVITYSFNNAGSQFTVEAAPFSVSNTALTAADKAITRAVLASIEAVSNVQFVEVADAAGQSGLLRYGYSQRPTEMGYAGYAFFPSANEMGGDVWLGKAQGGAEWDYYRPNLILHESLHAIGLKHPFDGASGLATERNMIPNTVMSYSPLPGAQSGAMSRYPSEPMPLDVQALQMLYGAAVRNEGSTSYDLADVSFQTFRAIWDSNGIDTLDASRVVKGVQLDLAGGARSDVGASIQVYTFQGNAAGRVSTQTNYSNTLALAPEARIENAIGSAFADVLLGNDLDNVIRGGEGDDVIDGRGGADRLLGGNGSDLFRVGGGRKEIEGGAGFDTVVFSGSSKDFDVAAVGGDYIVTSLRNPADVAVLRETERLEFFDMQLATQELTRATLPTESFSGQAFRLYRAALNRLPDEDGLAYQTGALAAGAGLSRVAGDFMASAEFQQRFGLPDNRDFVTLLYKNVLGRSPDEEGLSYHVRSLELWGLSRADVLVGFSESPENQAAIVGVAGGGLGSALSTA